MVTKEDVNSAYSRIRQLDSTIPDIVLEFMRHSSIDAMNGDADQVVIDGPQKGKEVWQFEEGEHPKLLSNNYVVETENFKRIGDWLIPKGYDEAFNVCKIHRIFKSDNPNEVWISTNDDSYAVTGAVEELLQVLA